MAFIQPVHAHGTTVPHEDEDMIGHTSKYTHSRMA